MDALPRIGTWLWREVQICARHRKLVAFEVPAFSLTSTEFTGAGAFVRFGTIFRSVGGHCLTRDVVANVAGARFNFGTCRLYVWRLHLGVQGAVVAFKDQCGIFGLNICIYDIASFVKLDL